MGVLVLPSTMQRLLACILLLAMHMQHSSSKSIDDGAECSGPPGGPHECFEQKHYCPECVTAAQAEAKSEGREAWTNQNTVLQEISSFEQRDDGWGEERCVGTPAKAWNCLYQNDRWSCREKGSAPCTNNHAVNNGHLFYGEMVCTKSFNSSAAVDESKPY